MNLIARIMTAFFDLLLLPFGNHHALGLVWLSLLTGVGMAFVFKWTSDAAAIRVAKDRLKARILEMRIYQDDPWLIVRAFGGTLKANGGYLATILRPFLVLIVPVVIVFIQMDERYARRPLEPGARTILTVQLEDGADPFRTPLRLSMGDGVAEDARPVRVAATGEIDWRLRVTAGGTHELTLSSGDATYALPVVAGPDYRMIGHERRSSGLLEPLLHPALPAIPKGLPIARVSLDYPGARYTLWRWQAHWIVIFVVYSFLSAIILKFIIKFEI